MPTISTLRAREILDSRGNPTVEVDCILDDGSFGRASVPSGASTGSHEALELRDDDPKRYGGKGVLTAVANVNTTIAQHLKGTDATNQREVDNQMISLDGTPTKSSLGANAILGVSLAVCKAAATSYKLPLYEYVRKTFQLSFDSYIIPTPMMNVLNGGKHAENSSDFQEYMVIPHHADSFARALQMGDEVFHSLKKVLLSMKQPVGVGDEGGFAPSLPSNSAPLDVLTQAVEQAGYTPGDDISFALDAAATEFYKDGTYQLSRDHQTLDSVGMTTYVEKLIATYPLASCEDILAEDDWDGWKAATAKLGSRVQLVGDDLFVTNTERLTKGIDQKVANSILIKLNQIGTLTETVLAVELSKKSGYTAIISHRSGETEDTSIADISVALNCGQIKTGSLSRTERIAKYNQLLRIEEALGTKSSYRGLATLAPHQGNTA